MTVQKFDPSTLMQGVKDRIKSEFVSLIPDEQWNEMVQKEINDFFKEKDTGYSNRTYASDFSILVRDIVIEIYVDATIGLEQIDTLNDIDLLLQKKVIATNNPNIDIPKVGFKIDLTKLCYYDRRNPDFSIKEEYGYDKEEVEATGNFAKKDCACDNCFYGRSALTEQLIKSQETHPFSEEDMIEFAEWCEANYTCNQKKKYWYKYADKTDDIKPYTTKELLQLWKEQRTKILYYL